VVEAVKRWLSRSQNRHWLLILDNADDLENINCRHFIPSANHGHVLITSRRSEVSHFWPESPHRVGEMVDGDGISLLLKSAHLGEEHREIASQIVTKLGHLALAIDHAGAYIYETQLDIKRYLPIYEQHRKNLLDRRPGMEPEQVTVFTTWEISFEQLQRLNEASTLLLTLISFLDQNLVPLDLLRFYTHAPLMDSHPPYPPSLSSPREAATAQIAAPFKWLTDLDAKKRTLVEVESNSPSLREAAMVQIADPLQWLTDLNTNERLFTEAYAKLLSFSFATPMASDIFHVHPLVHWWGRERLGDTERKDWVKKGQALLTSAHHGLHGMASMSIVDLPEYLSMWNIRVVE